MANSYWNDEMLVKKVIHAFIEGEGTDWTELVVDIHVPDSAGKYIAKEMYCLTHKVYPEKYPYEIGSEEEQIALDELLEVMDEELQEVAKRHDLLLEGVGIHIGWYDSMIATVIYREEGN